MKSKRKAMKKVSRKRKYAGREPSGKSKNSKVKKLMKLAKLRKSSRKKKRA